MSGAVSSLSTSLSHYNTADEEKTRTLASHNLICFDGLGGQRVYVFPDHALVIVRTGVLDGGYEDPILPNLVLEGVVTEIPGSSGTVDVPATDA